MTTLEKQIKLYEIYTILGDTVRSGPLLWKVDRKRLNDVKNHTFDLLLMTRLLKESIDYPIDFEKVEDYIFIHDLPEAITGDITAFEGVSKEIHTQVTKEAIDYLEGTFNNMLHIKENLKNYEKLIDLESKIAHMLDKAHSAIEFIHYESEKEIDANNEKIPSALRNLDFVQKAINQGQSVSDIFYHYHRSAIAFTDDELEKYMMTREDAEKITQPILSFFDSFYEQKVKGILKNNTEDFLKSATIYAKRNL